MKIICVVGMPSSGKTIVSDKAKQLGIFTLTFDDIVREEMQIKGIIYTKNNKRKMSEWFYKNHKEMMRRIIDKITQSNNSDKIVIEGLISPKQIQDLKDRLNQEELSILAIHSSPKIRFERRNQNIDYYMLDYKNIKESDNIGIKMGLSEVIAMADHMIINDGDLLEFRETVKHKLIELLNIDVKR